MDKSRIYGKELRRSKESFYNYAIKMVLRNSFGKIQGARLKMDGHGDRAFRRGLLAYLRREVDVPDKPSVIADLKFVDSKQNVLIQLADMVAGALRRCADGEKDDGKTYRAAIEKWLEDVWDFGRGTTGR